MAAPTLPSITATSSNAERVERCQSSIEIERRIRERREGSTPAIAEVGPAGAQLDERITAETLDLQPPG